MKFRPKNLDELANLDEEDLLAYLVTARKAGAREQMAAGVYVLVGKRRAFVRAMVALKTPPQLHDELVNDIFADVVESATKGKPARDGFKGGSMGEFVNFVKTIAHRRIVDALKKHKRRIQADPLDHDGEDDWGPEAEGGVTDPEAAAMVKDARERVMAGRDETHQKVIVLRLAGVPSKKVVEQIPGMSVANVDKIFSRYNKELAIELGG